MPDEDPRDRLSRLRRDIESHFASGWESLSRMPAMVNQNLIMNHSGDRLHRSQADSASTEDSRGLADWQEQESASVEARLDQCRGGRLEDHHYAWDLFLRRSQYSPLILDRQLSVRPRPYDAEDDMDPDLFSWRDAFEDLLAASSGLPMASTRDRYNHRKFLSRISLIEPVDLWLAQLQAQRLTEAYFPLREWDHQSPQTMEEWVRLRQAEADHRARLEQEASQRAREFVRAFGFDSDRASKPRGSAAGEDRGQKEETEPRSELDWFDFIHTASKEVLPPLTAFLKIFTNGKWETNSSTTTSSTVRTSEHVDEETLKTTRSTEEWIKDGCVHVKTEVRKTTPDGREVSRETHYTVRSVKPEELDSSATAAGAKDDAQSEVGDTKAWSRKEDGQGGKKNSWLWK
ncbi:hypothetical protein GQ53DRAFT_79503 [Thozetella sp. PMI_491]|nr:hypothetical protein GQ53DRAFT_79503 [Thozetella sp. PMI_491]